MVLDINAYVYLMPKSLSLVSSVFVCSLIQLHRKCLLSSCLKINCLENCERERDLWVKKKNQHFSLNERMVSVECRK